MNFIKNSIFYFFFYIYTPIAAFLCPHASVLLPLSSCLCPLDSVLLPLSSCLCPLASVLLPLSSCLCPLAFLLLSLFSWLCPLDYVLLPLSSWLCPLASLLSHASRLSSHAFYIRSSLPTWTQIKVILASQLQTKPPFYNGIKYHIPLIWFPEVWNSFIVVIINLFNCLLLQWICSVFSSTVARRISTHSILHMHTKCQYCIIGHNCERVPLSPRLP